MLPSLRGAVQGSSPHPQLLCLRQRKASSVSGQAPPSRTAARLTAQYRQKNLNHQIRQTRYRRRLRYQLPSELRDVYMSVRTSLREIDLP